MRWLGIYKTIVASDWANGKLADEKINKKLTGPDGAGARSVRVAIATAIAWYSSQPAILHEGTGASDVVQLATLDERTRALEQAVRAQLSHVNDEQAGSSDETDGEEGSSKSAASSSSVDLDLDLPSMRHLVATYTKVLKLSGGLSIERPEVVGGARQGLLTHDSDLDVILRVSEVSSSDEDE